jgi:predicted nucleic acid-binding Zn ribbon protein
VNRRGPDEPVALGDALARVRSELGLPESDVLGRLETRWPDIVGEPVAAHARLVALRDGVLTVAVDSPPWATQLTYLERDVVERATAVVGAGSVRAIAVRVEAETGARKRANSGAKRTGPAGPSGTLQGT